MFAAAAWADSTPLAVPADPQSSAAAPVAHHPVDPVVMEKVVVGSPKNDLEQRRNLAKQPPIPLPPFSITRGGVVGKKDFKKSSLEAGAQANQDVMAKDSKYKDKKPLPRVDLLRLRW